MSKLWIALCLLLAAGGPAQAQSRGTVILVPGSGGGTPNDFLVRNQQAYEAAGFTTRIAVGSAAAQNAAASAGGGKVYGVGMSAGATHLAEAIAGGARFDRVVFVSAAYLPPPSNSAVGSGVIATLGSPARLPPTLAVHNRNDICPNTPPEGARRFVAWSKGRARLQFLASSAMQSPPCRARSPHGFLGADAQATRTIIGFLR
jgi:hypothetical protein